MGRMGRLQIGPQPESFMNSLALVAAGRPSTAPTMHPYANDGNSYINHLRDNGFVERYNVDRRVASPYQYGTYAFGGQIFDDPDGDGRPPPKPRLPLSSFYKADNTLAWPADAPWMVTSKESERLSMVRAARAQRDEEERGRVPGGRDRGTPKAGRIRPARVAIRPRPKLPASLTPFTYSSSRSMNR